VTLLSLQSVTMRFGGLVAVSDFDLDLPAGALWGLIGPNGAGKTTVFNIITGVYRPTSGRVVFAGHDIVGTRPDLVTRLGIARTFQNIRLFDRLSVLDNVLVARHLRRGSTVAEAVLGLPRYSREAREMRDQSMDLLRSLGLEAVRDEYAGSLPYGQQRRVEIARALATEPRLLLLDEPAAGMNPYESGELTDFVGAVRERYRLTILLIEHQMRVVMRICERIVVLDHGVTIAQGTPEEVRADERVIQAYLGVSRGA